MGKILNTWSFFMVLLSGGLIFVLSSNIFASYFIHWVGIHPLKMIFYFTIMVFFIGIIGFSGVTDWKGALRSVITVGLAAFIILFLAYIIFVGHLTE
jgi:hypothetical protein